MLSNCKMDTIGYTSVYIHSTLTLMLKKKGVFFHQVSIFYTEAIAQHAYFVLKKKNLNKRMQTESPKITIRINEGTFLFFSYNGREQCKAQW